MELHEALAMCAALTPPACACAPDLPDDAVLVTRLYRNSRSGPDKRALAEPVSRSAPPKRSSSKKAKPAEWHQSSLTGRKYEGSAGGVRSQRLAKFWGARSENHRRGVEGVYLRERGYI